MRGAKYFTNLNELIKQNVYTKNYINIINKLNKNYLEQH